MEANKPVQVGPDWWMAFAPSGHKYFHNTTTNVTTWTKPDGVTVPGETSAKDMDKEAMAYLGGASGPGPQGGGGGRGGGGGGGEVNNLSIPATGDAPAITVSGNGQIPPPWTSFDQVRERFPQQLIAPMLQAGFKAPSPIQQHSWPIAVTGRDMVGIAKTGSGKTLGFLMPAFAKCMQERLQGAPIILVMAPTRELACQIDADAKKFAGPAGVLTALAYGGAPKGPQLGDLRKRPHLLTGTPGRLNDFLEGRMINLSTVRFLVLDEADRMLDMGFEPQIRKVIHNVPRQRQTMMFSATWPKEVRRLASEFMHDPLEVRIGNADELQANKDIEQQVVVCQHAREKEDRLVQCIRAEAGQVIIFTRTKRMCDQLSRSLSRMNVRCEAIHGDRDQRERDMALEAFKAGRSRILVATDVAARGLDVKDVTLVLNFDPAGNAEDYVHRIGRTGRAGRKGKAITFLTPDEGKSADQIAQVMQKTGLDIPEDLARLAATAGGGGRSRGKGKGKGRDRSRSRRRSRSRGRQDSRSRSRGRGGPPGGAPGGPMMGGHPGMPMQGHPGMPMQGYPPHPGMPMQGYPPHPGAHMHPGMPGMMPGMRPY